MRNKEGQDGHDHNDNISAIHLYVSKKEIHRLFVRLVPNAFLAQLMSAASG